MTFNEVFADKIVSSCAKNVHLVFRFCLIYGKVTTGYKDVQPFVQLGSVDLPILRL